MSNDKFQNNETPMTQKGLMDEFCKVSEKLRQYDSKEGAGKLCALQETAAKMLSTYESVELMHSNVRMAEASARSAEAEARRVEALNRSAFLGPPR